MVALSLSKRPETRYQKGEQFSKDLRAVMDLPSGADVMRQNGGANASEATEKTVAFTATVAGMEGSAGKEGGGTIPGNK